MALAEKIMLKDLRIKIQEHSDPQKAKSAQRYFKTAEGQYAAGDIFLGLTVPESRSIAKQFFNLNLTDILTLLHSKYHEERLISLLILIEQFKKADEKLKKQIFQLYLENTTYINNWDLVDLSADKIVGEYLLDKNKDILQRLAKSKLLWDKRVAIISTYRFIKDQHDPTQTFLISDLLISDKHDLIHKAVGWMLREVGKNCSQQILEEYLKTRYKTMPRTMLRYAIERFPEQERRKYLLGLIE